MLKYFGFNGQDYTSYSTLFQNSSVVPGTGFGQLLQSPTVGIDLCRTVIAKPASGATNGFLDANTLSAAFSRARSDFGWFGGYANLNLASDQLGQFQKQVLSSLRQDCMFMGDCTCL